MRPKKRAKLSVKNILSNVVIWINGYTESLIHGQRDGYRIKGCKDRYMDLQVVTSYLDIWINSKIYGTLVDEKLINYLTSKILNI